MKMLKKPFRIYYQDLAARKPQTHLKLSSINYKTAKKKALVKLGHNIFHCPKR